MGYGFRGWSPPWPYVGRGRGGLPRCGYYVPAAPVPNYQPPVFTSAPGYAPYPSVMPREQELDYLKDQAQAIKEQLEQIDARMHDLEEKEQ